MFIKLSAQEAQFAEVDPRFLLIWAVILAIGILIYRVWLKKYEGIPDKRITAIRVKNRFYPSDPGSDTAGARDEYSVGKYEFEIDGKKYKKSFRFDNVTIAPDQVDLLYKKGKSDLRFENWPLLPLRHRFIRLIYFVFGPVLIAMFIWSLFFDVPYILG